jgi:DNA-binding MarR family transcriptional regulator
MAGALDPETAELLLALVASPGGRATPGDLAERLDRPGGLVARQLREAQRAGLVDSAITLGDRPGRDRMFWLTADKGLRALFEAGGGRAPGDE